MKNGFRVAICVMLVVAVLAMSLSVCAIDMGDRIQSREYLWCYYIWVFLNSIGIQVTYQGVVEYNDYVIDTIIDWSVMYIADLIEADSQPSNYSIAKWVAPWQAEYDYWGNLQFNSTMLEDMQDFAEWLKSELSLVDNSTIIVQPEWAVNGYTLYQFDSYYRVEDLDEVTDNVLFSVMYDETTSINAIGYFNLIDYTGNTPVSRLYVVTNTTGQFNWTRYEVDYNGVNVAGSSGGTRSWNTNVQGSKYANMGTLSRYDPAYTPFGKPIQLAGSNPGFYTTSDMNTFLNNFVVEEIGDVSVVTLSIQFPSENPDYTEGDGMVIIDGEPVYQEVTFSGVIENLPAVVSTGTVTNPGLDTFWGFIPVLAEQTKDAIVLARGLIYELPEELVVTFYAVMGGLILFGVIKLMREH